MINKSALVKALAAVKPGLSNKEILEQTCSVVFSDGVVFTYNDSIMVSHPHPAPQEFHCIVDAKLLHSYLSKIKDEEIELATSETELQIKGKRSTAKLPSQFEVSPVLHAAAQEQKAVTKWGSLPAKFNEGLKHCHGITGKDATKPALTCIHISNTLMEACDGFKLIRYNLDKKTYRTPLLIPSKAAAELHKYDCDQFAVSEGWLHFKNKGTGVIFSCRTIAEQYPDLSKFIPKHTEEIELPKNFSEILERASTFCQGILDNNLIHIDIKDGVLKTSVNSAFGSFSEESRIRYKGGEISFQGGHEALAFIASKDLKIMVAEKVVMIASESATMIGAIVRG